jgi:S-adenosylmethionine:tRNA ribosyltransferase-isomerase
MKVSDFDFPLPQSLIAEQPAPRRDGSRLMVLGRGGGIEHRRFYDLPEYLEEGDMLLLNRTRVLPFRLRGVKPTGGRLDILLVRNIAGDRWEILSTGKYTGPLAISGKLTAEIHGGRTADLAYSGDLKEILWEAGEMPLPPYIRRGPNGMDKERYQTVYARDDGSIAAPTAGLHFTGELLAAIEAKGVLVRYLTLHVGKGTFAPIRTDNVQDHVMEPEFFEIERDLVSEIKDLKGRLVAVGTTATRAVEGFMAGRYSSIRNGRNGGNGGRPFAGSTDIFIYPGSGPSYRFRAVTSLVTNFHLPRSTPLMLASALCGRERLLAAYAEAVREKYRFFSYGDAMLIL